MEYEPFWDTLKKTYFLSKEVSPLKVTVALLPTRGYQDALDVSGLELTKYVMVAFAGLRVTSKLITLLSWLSMRFTSIPFPLPLSSTTGRSGNTQYSLTLKFCICKV
jgi:hypothetical protein